MSSRSRPDFRTTLALVAFLVCSACASFRGDELPERSLHEEVEQGRLPAATYEYSLVSGTAGAPWSPGPEWVDRICAPIFSQVFSEIERKESAEGLHLHMQFEVRHSRPVSFTYGLALIAIASAFLIPVHGRDDLILTVRVDVEGALATRYEYEDHIDSWLHLFMIPWAHSHEGMKVYESVLENLLLNFLHDLRRDLPGFPKPAAG